MGLHRTMAPSNPRFALMARRLTVVVSQGQSANPAKRQLEEDIVAALLFEKGIEVTVIPHLYDLKPDGTGMLALQGITGNMVVLAWLFPRAAFWTLHRFGIQGRFGTTLIEPEDDEDDDLDEQQADEAQAEAQAAATAGRDLPNRWIYCLDLRWHGSVQTYVDEIKRIAAEASIQTVHLGGLAGDGLGAGGNGQGNGKTPGNGSAPGGLGSLPIVSASASTAQPAPGAAAAAGETTPAASDSGPGEASAILRVEENTGRRWYPVIDFDRCTNCMECLDFCLFGVYGVDRFDTILVEQPDNCRKGCPACSRVCPENAIIFPQHKSPAIAGSPEKSTAALKIDLSKLFGAPDEDPMATAIQERDRELLAAGRDAVGATVGIPKRQAGRADEPKDELDELLDQLDELDL